MNSQRVVVADILKPRGIRGELLAISQTDVPGRLETLREAWVHLANGEDRAIAVETAWPHQTDWVLKFAGIDSIEQAEELRGAELWVPLAERASLPEGEYFQSDLVGLNVVDARDGTPLGVVQEIQQYGGPALLAMAYQGREVLIPLVADFCQVDLPAKVVRVTLPEGLLDL